MQDLELCAHILGLEAPWVVDEVKVDRPSKRIDIVIGLGSGRRALFRKTASCPRCGRELPAPRDLRRVTLRHLNIGDMRTYLTVPLCDNAGASAKARSCVCHKRWGKLGSRFSSEMETHVLEALNLLKSPQQVARLLGVAAAEVREIGEHNGAAAVGENIVGRQAPQFNQGGLEVTIIDQAAMEAPATPPPTAVPVPPETHPVWMRIIQGSAVVTAAPVSFKMLLEQIRLSTTTYPTEASRRAGVRLLRQYFIKYWSRLRGEIESLVAEGGESVAVKPPAVDTSPVPEEKDNCWQLLVDGKLPLSTDAVALKMLLERVRLSLGSQADPAHRLAGARALRSYFTKYRSRLQKELRQLQANAGTAMNMTPPTPRRLHVPAETDSCWRHLILGELELRTEIVALTMLLERVRQSLGAAPSEAALLAATRALRQFFVKYAARLRGEVEQLIRAGTGPVPVLSSGGQVVEFVEVPPENHPSWQRLIEGELELKTDALSLKMLLERIRLTIGPDADEVSRLAAARILRQYFIKYRGRHRAELEQLKVA